MNQGLGCMSQGLGCMSQGLGCMSQGLGCMSQGLGCMSQGLGCMSQGLGCKSQGLGCMSQGLGPGYEETPCTFAPFVVFGFLPPARLPIITPSLAVSHLHMPMASSPPPPTCSLSAMSRTCICMPHDQPPSPACS